MSTRLRLATLSWPPTTARMKRTLESSFSLVASASYRLQWRQVCVQRKCRDRMAASLPDGAGTRLGAMRVSCSTVTGSAQEGCMHACTRASGKYLEHGLAALLVVVQAQVEELLQAHVTPRQFREADVGSCHVEHVCKGPGDDMQATWVSQPLLPPMCLCKVIRLCHLSAQCCSRIPTSTMASGDG